MAVNLFPRVVGPGVHMCKYGCVFGRNKSTSTLATAVLAQREKQYFLPSSRPPKKVEKRPAFPSGGKDSLRPESQIFN